MSDPHPHRRFNPLRNEWVLVSPQRNTRPWQGQVEPPEPERAPAYDPACYLCPGNPRAHGVRNPDYTSTFVFDNDFPALVPDNSRVGTLNAQGSTLNAQESLLIAQPARGLCRVICFSPRHDLTLARMETADIRRVIDVWAAECAAAAARPWVR